MQDRPSEGSSQALFSALYSERRIAPDRWRTIPAERSAAVSVAVAVSVSLTWQQVDEQMS